MLESVWVIAFAKYPIFLKIFLIFDNFNIIINVDKVISSVSLILNLITVWQNDDRETEYHWYPQHRYIYVEAITQCVTAKTRTYTVYSSIHYHPQPTTDPQPKPNLFNQSESNGLSLKGRSDQVNIVRSSYIHTRTWLLRNIDIGSPNKKL